MRIGSIALNDGYGGSFDPDYLGRGNVFIGFDSGTTSFPIAGAMSPITSGAATLPVVISPCSISEGGATTSPVSG